MEQVALRPCLLHPQSLRREDSKFQPIKQHQVASKNQTEANDEVFSACLLTMDDSHFLIEWLAFHYHTLPLRHLIVAVDPNSITSPSKLFDRWRNHGMTIEEWSDEDFMEKAKNRTTQVHRRRQRLFYQQCMRKLKQQKRKWVLLIDVDEYLAFNTHTEQLDATVENSGAVASFLQQELGTNDTMLQKEGCIIILRLQYGSKESALEDISKEVPKGFNASAFQTLRFRKHAPLESFQYNRKPKIVIDLSKVPMKDIVVVDVHRPIKGLCPEAPKGSTGVHVKHSPLQVRH